MANTWHLLTGEYPPGGGGVADYTFALAQALDGAGDVVHVWTPAGAPHADGSRVSVHILPDVFGPATCRTLEAELPFRSGTVLLQYVPNALGARGANVAFCRWFGSVARRSPDVRVMFHEPYFYFTWSAPWAPSNALAFVQRVMARLLLRAASQVYFSTETWNRYLRPVRPAQTLPIPSSLPVATAADEIARMRRTATGGGDGAMVVGHFGTYGAHVAGELDPILPAIAARMPSVRFALLGAGGAAFLDRLRTAMPDLAQRAWAPDRLDASDVAAAIRACDVLVQPYPDGITTRRTSVMAGLKNGVATVTTTGALTEAVWSETSAVALIAAGDVDGVAAETERLLRDSAARTSLAERGASAYAARFSIEHTVAILRGTEAA